MPTTYEISIEMDSDTIDKLKDGGYALYAFKAAKTPQNGGVPLVWFQGTSFLTQTRLTWEEQYQAYISTSQIIPDGRIDAVSHQNIELGQKMQVTENGRLSVVTDGTKGAISISNEGATPWVCGISQVVNGKATPLCALPLHGNMVDVFVPLSKVVLMFASRTFNTGTVVYKAYSSGVLLDMTDAKPRTVKFDINKGWDWGQSPSGTKVPQSAEMVPLLIAN